MRKFLAILAGITMTAFPYAVLAASPTIVDTLPLTGHDPATGTGETYSYTAGAGSNRLLFIMVRHGGALISATYAGTSFHSVPVANIGTPPQNSSGMQFLYLKESEITSGSNNVVTSYSNNAEPVYYGPFTIQDVNQTSPINASTTIGDAQFATQNNVIVASNATDLVMSSGVTQPSTMTVSSYGASETAIGTVVTTVTRNWNVFSTWKASTSSVSTSMLVNTASGNYIDLGAVSIQYQAPAAGGAAVVPPNFSSYWM